MFKPTEFFYGKKNDHQLEKNLRERIAWDKRVSLQDLQIEVVSGHVTVTGKVDADYKQEAVVEIIRGVEGVWEVDCKIEIDPRMKRTDEEIESTLELIMSRLWLKPGESISVSVKDGVVALEGTVFRKHIKSLAGSMAWELSGVRDVHNLLELKDDNGGRISHGELMQFV